MSLYWIVVEGPDNAGKTTLINELLQKLVENVDGAVNFRHFNGPRAASKNAQMLEKKIEAFAYVDELNKKYDESLVHDVIVVEVNDRSIFGELVYSEYRGYYPDYFEELLQALNPGIKLMFVCLYANRRTLEIFELNEKDNGKLHGSTDYMEKVSIGFFREIQQLSVGRKLFVNSNNYVTLDKRNDYVYKNVDCFLSNKQFKFSKTNSFYETPFSLENREFNGYHFGTGVGRCNGFNDGSCKYSNEHRILLERFDCVDKVKPIFGYGNVSAPKIVIVGEQSHYNANVFLGLPFYNSTSSNLVQQALYKANLSVLDVYVTNVLKCITKTKVSVSKNIECVQELEKELRKFEACSPRIICLGKVAYNCVKSLHLNNVSYMAHPSYFLRSGYGSVFIEEFVNMIKNK